MPPLDRRLRFALAVVLGVAAVARVVWATRMEPPGSLADPFFYLTLGQSLADGHGYSYPRFDPATGALAGYFPTAYYPPGYPLFLGGVFALAQVWPGDVSPFGLAVAANVVLSVVLVGLVFALGRRMAGPGVGLLAAAFTALWPNLVFHSGVALTETLFLCLLVLTLLVALATPEVARRPGRRRLLVVGALLALVVLVRPVSFVVAPLLVVLWWPDGLARAARRMAVVAAAAAAVLAPWAILSTARVDAPVLVSLNLGDNLCIGYHDGADGSFVHAPECLEGYEHLDKPEYETRRNADNIDRAVSYATHHPWEALRLIPARARHTLAHDDDGIAAAEDYGAHSLFAPSHRHLLRGAADGHYLGMLALTAAGVTLLVRHGFWADRRWRLLVLAAPAQLLAPLLTFGDARFKMPIYPTLAVCAATAIALAAGTRQRPAVDGYVAPQTTAGAVSEHDAEPSTAAGH